MKKILVVMGGPSNEHEVSLHTGQMVVENINKNFYDVKTVIIEKNGNWDIDEKSFNSSQAINFIKKNNYDLVFIALHGAFGEDGKLQKLLEENEIKYTGSSSQTAALAMDKYSTSQLYKDSGMDAPKMQKLSKISEKITIPLPFVVKPNEGGSSIGISIVKTEEAIRPALEKAFSEYPEVLIEEYLIGQEFTCAVLETEEGTKALSPIMIIPNHSEFFDYDAKYNAEAAEEIVNPDIGKKKIDQLKNLALKAHKLLGCKGFSRSDFIEVGNKFFIIETNVIPGMTDNSLLPKSAKGSGIDFKELIDIVIKVGLRG